MEQSQIDEIEKQVVDRFLTAAEKAECQSCDDWTRLLMEAAALVGESHGYQVLCHSLPWVEREWLWDMAWLARDELSALADVALALESQWKTNQVLGDFEKLLVSRARLRVMLFAADEPQVLIDKMIGRIQRYTATQKGGRYLFVCRSKSVLKFKPYMV